MYIFVLKQNNEPTLNRKKLDIIFYEKAQQYESENNAEMVKCFPDSSLKLPCGQ